MNPGEGPLTVLTGGARACKLIARLLHVLKSKPPVFQIHLEGAGGMPGVLHGLTGSPDVRKCLRKSGA